jgi:transcriptional regulator with XRE-family HTH domain
MGLLRSLLGGVLRQQRLRQGRTLRDVSAAAQVSLGYISEVERGQKEASSELLAAICSALEVPLSDVLREVSEQMAFEEAAIAAGIVDADLDRADLDRAALAPTDLAPAAA